MASGKHNVTVKMIPLYQVPLLPFGMSIDGQHFIFENGIMKFSLCLFSETWVNAKGRFSSSWILGISLAEVQ